MLILSLVLRENHATVSSRFVYEVDFLVAKKSNVLIHHASYKHTNQKPSFDNLRQIKHMIAALHSPTSPKEIPVLLSHPSLVFLLKRRLNWP
jgi:hypothetical protein